MAPFALQSSAEGSIGDHSAARLAGLPLHGQPYAPGIRARHRTRDGSIRLRSAPALSRGAISPPDHPDRPNRSIHSGTAESLDQVLWRIGPGGIFAVTQWHKATGPGSRAARGRSTQPRPPPPRRRPVQPVTPSCTAQSRTVAAAATRVAARWGSADPPRDATDSRPPQGPPRLRPTPRQWRTMPQTTTAMKEWVNPRCPIKAASGREMTEVRRPTQDRG